MIATLFSIANVSAKATGASFTAVTVRARLEVEVRLPSVTVTVTVGTEPNQLESGVKTYLPSALTVRSPLPVTVAVWPAV